MNGVISGDTLTGTITTNETLTGQLSNAKSVDLSHDTITASDLKSGVKAHDSTGTQIIGEMVNNGAVAHVINTKDDQYTIPEGYHNGNGIVGIDSSEQDKIIPENIKKDTTILGITGTLKGGYGYTKLGEKEVSISTTSTSPTLQTTIDCGSEAFTKDALIYVRVRDIAGKRKGYFLGEDNFLNNVNKANGDMINDNYCVKILYMYTSNGKYYNYVNGTYGIYVDEITTAGQVKINSRYNSSWTGTINGTYKIEVYALDYPDGITPFDI